MRVALAVPRQPRDPRKSLGAVLTMTARAAARGAGLVVFPEASLTGLANNDDPCHDLRLGVRVPGPEAKVLSAAALQHNIWIAVGLFERTDKRLFDTAILISPRGRIVLRYRRISTGWRGSRADSRVYGRGRALPVAQTPFGVVAFLVCGDLFDDRLVARIRKLRADWLMIPLARCFEDGTSDQARWNREEKPAYFSQVRKSGAAALLVNSFDRRTRSFGGAWAVSACGEEIASLPLGQPGMLVADLNL